MTLHNEIMNIQCDNSDTLGKDPMITYKIGHRDARHAAAELAIKYDAAMAEIERIADRLGSDRNYERCIAVEDLLQVLANFDLGTDAG